MLDQEVKTNPRIRGSHTKYRYLMNLNSCIIFLKTFIKEKFLYEFIGMHIIFKRHMGYYLLQVYVPGIMLVILSWVSFYINREATADRSCIGEYLNI